MFFTYSAQLSLRVRSSSALRVQGRVLLAWRDGPRSAGCGPWELRLLPMLPEAAEPAHLTSTSSVLLGASPSTSLFFPIFRYHFPLLFHIILMASSSVGLVL